MLEAWRNYTECFHRVTHPASSTRDPLGRSARSCLHLILPCAWKAVSSSTLHRWDSWGCASNEQSPRLAAKDLLLKKRTVFLLRPQDALHPVAALPETCKTPPLWPLPLAPEAAITLAPPTPRCLAYPSRPAHLQGGALRKNTPLWRRTGRSFRFRQRVLVLGERMAAGRDPRLGDVEEDTTTHLPSGLGRRGEGRGGEWCGRPGHRNRRSPHRQRWSRSRPNPHRPRGPLVCVCCFSP